VQGGGVGILYHDRCLRLSLYAVSPAALDVSHPGRESQYYAMLSRVAELDEFALLAVSGASWLRFSRHGKGGSRYC